MPYLFLLLALIGSWGYSFYKGYQYANKDYIIRQQTAKIRHLEVTERYYREANNSSQGEANKTAQSLEISEKQLEAIRDQIRQGKFGSKACSDELFNKLRGVQ
jgi:hypothetical protein